MIHIIFCFIVAYMNMVLIKRVHPLCLRTFKLPHHESPYAFVILKLSSLINKIVNIRKYRCKLNTRRTVAKSIIAIYTSKRVRYRRYISNYAYPKHKLNSLLIFHKSYLSVFRGRLSVYGIILKVSINQTV